MQTNQQQTPQQAAPEWITLKDAARQLDKSKSAIEYHARKLDSSDRMTDANGVIHISAAAVDRIRAKLRSTQQVPNKYPKTVSGTQQVPENSVSGTKQVPESSVSRTQEAPENSVSGTQQVPNTDAAAAALDALNGIISGLQAELKEERKAKQQYMEQAEQLRRDVARIEEREKAAAARADHAAQEVAELKAQNQTLTEQLAAIADKQADALRAGAAEQLALAIPEQDTRKKGLFARLFQKKRD